MTLSTLTCYQSLHLVSSGTLDLLVLGEGMLQDLVVAHVLVLVLGVKLDLAHVHIPCDRILAMKRLKVNERENTLP